VNDLPMQLDAIAGAVREKIIPGLGVALLTETHAKAIAAFLELSATEARCLLRQTVPPASRVGGNLPDGVTDLDAARQRRRRLRLVAGGAA
jgi:hypothetical protein